MYYSNKFFSELLETEKASVSALQYLRDIWGGRHNFAIITIFSFGFTWLFLS